MSQLVLQSTTLTTPSAGTLEYDGKVPYFTPQGTERGIVPGMQYYRLNTSLTGSNVNTAQNILGVGVTLSGSTVYAFEAYYVMTKTAGTTSHTIGFGFGGTATVNNISWQVASNWSGSSSNPVGVTTGAASAYSNVTTNTTSTTAFTTANVYFFCKMSGTISVNAGGTLIPQYTLSAAPGGAYTVAAGSYFSIYPVGTAGSNTNVGTWA